MITAIIIDDEQASIDVLKIKLSRFCPQINVVGEADDPMQGLTLIRSLKPNVVFLDVEMPEMTGFELMNEMDMYSSEVVIITAHQHYSIKAIRKDAFDFLLKPVDVDELVEVVNRLVLKEAQKKVTEKNTSNWTKLQTDFNKIILPTGKGFIFSPINDIIRLESFGCYTNLHMASGQKILSTKSIGDYEEMLAAYHFLRVHHSHLINLNYILEYQKSDNILVMNADGRETASTTKIPVSKRKKKEFLLMING
jgi:two-component system, LytTR family, response regulator